MGYAVAGVGPAADPGLGLQGLLGLLGLGLEALRNGVEKCGHEPRWGGLVGQGPAPHLLPGAGERILSLPLAPPLSPGVVPDGTRHDLLEEVANLVEAPTVVLGSFDPAFLALPREVSSCCVVSFALLFSVGVAPLLALGHPLPGPACLPAYLPAGLAWRAPCAHRPPVWRPRCRCWSW